MMSTDTLNAIAEELQVDPATLQSDVVLEDLEGWNSVAALTISVIIADETGSPVSPAELQNLRTFGDIEQLVAARQG